MQNNSKKERINHLLDKCISQRITASEREELNRYIQDADQNEIIQHSLLQSFYKEKELVDMPLDQQNMIWNSLRGLGRPATSPKIIRASFLKWIAVAAVALLILAPLTFHINTKQIDQVFSRGPRVKKQVEHDNNTQQPVNDRFPAKDQAVLTMFDGTVLQLDELEIGKEIHIEGLRVEKQGKGDLVFQFKETDNQKVFANNSMNTLVTPRGGTYHIKLADGTQVQLNSSSRLTFPSMFADNARKVEFEGEGYFEVAKDPDKKFIVETVKNGNRQQVVVYGTQFNICAYPEDEGITTTLIEGSVKISSHKNELFLKPMEQAIVKGEEIAILPANLDVNLAWKNDMFYFINEPLADVMAQVSRWYDIDIEYVGEVPTFRLWAQISRTKKLSELLEVLQQTNDIHFEIDGKEVRVMK
ncbi:DUF4974 domain-containing protein [Sphingobacterium alkalisoli]|uniref:DUF4974 domain-containing protein n=1 Tax=Sphingobacterium alkalisoli TaxID=1874115 RepID=A0A4U0HCR1_9SPHI|nr:FecR family protein [Sphingobacterium alkalisoli]TJY68412.1 DUF4974 domain-containing protein [Sphingobacterium alkalisoli]GGH06675.1 hypothetical protein GCM10011418_03500 [Sphingobacterium alkalisoli]